MYFIDYGRYSVIEHARAVNGQRECIQTGREPGREGFGHMSRSEGSDEEGGILGGGDSP